MSASAENPSGNASTAPATTPRIPVDRDWLDRQRMLRGWVRKRDLADALGVTAETVSDLYTKGWTGPQTWKKLRDLLAATPPDEQSVRLMGLEPDEGAA